MKQIDSRQISYTGIYTDSFLKKYTKRKDVDCIYLLSYKQEDYNVFDLTIVFKNKVSKKIEDKFDKLNTLFESENCIDSFGGKLRLLIDESSAYSILAMNPSEITRVRDLLSSQILYDKKGKYKKIAHQFDTYRTLEPYENSFQLRLK